MNGTIKIIPVIITCLVVVSCKRSSDTISDNSLYTPQSHVLELQKKIKKQSIGKYAYYLEDRDGSLKVQDVLRKTSIPGNDEWITSNYSEFNFGFTSSVYWIRIDIENPFINEMTFNIEVDYPHIDYIDVYQVKRNKILLHRSSGDKKNFHERDFYYRNTVFIIDQSIGTYSYYIRCQSESSMSLPIYLWTHQELLKAIHIESYILGIYYGIMIVILLYSFLLFLSLKDPNYMYYLFWVISYTAYQFTINGLGYQYLWHDSQWITEKSIPFFICICLIFAVQFGRSFLVTKTYLPRLDRFLYFLILLNSIAIIFVLFLPYKICIQFAAHSVPVISCTMLLAGIWCLFKGQRTARFYVTAWTALFLGLSVFAFKAIGLIQNNTMVSWAQQAGSAIQVILLSLALADKINTINNEKRTVINEMNIKLKEHNKQLNKAYKQISRSEERYRMLIEGSHDIIFSLDKQWNIVSANNAVENIFKIPYQQLIGENFIDLIYESEFGRSMGKNVILQKLKYFQKNKEPLVFKAEFISSIKQEPQELQIMLQYLDIGGKPEILCRASTVEEDALLKYFITEAQTLNIDNYLTTAEDISFRITRNIIKYMNSKDLNLLRMALREILLNAIEHGNLNITFQEKTKAMIKDEYFELIAKRRQNARYKNRKVKITYSLTPDKVHYTIEDQGKGFDHNKIVKKDYVVTKNEMLWHGRGILLATKIFHEVTYNKKGNIVTLIRHFHPKK